MSEEKTEKKTEKKKKAKNEPEIKLFGKWSLDGIEVRDPGLRAYICLKPIYLPHSFGRHAKRRFQKANVNIVERLANKLMRKGKNTGKKYKALKIVENALQMIELETGENPVQVLVRAIENSAPKMETTRVMYGGIVYRKAVDVSPQRRLDLALRFIAEGASLRSFSSIKSIDECLFEEILYAANNDRRSYAIQRKNEIERIARSAR
ncbi:30S ribosomal protein S7 [archaeon]|nr:MAG: 30S ribosomal protein S7 [archaeon]RLG66159.1 MAG: 30S ribosomal protein S7 [archaeon]HDM24092.1 30S ribosomal protein S7 [Candidatus Bathyarchaeota archaeon]